MITQADSVSDGCSDCGVVSERVHAWCRQRVKDIPHTDGVELILAKPRLVCGERACPRRTFTQTTPELPLRARCTSRLRRGVLETRPTRCWCRGRIWDRLVDGPQERQRRRRRAAWRGRRPPRTPLGDRRAPLPSGPLVPRPRHRRVAAGRTVDDGLGQCRFSAGPRNRWLPWQRRGHRVAGRSQPGLAGPHPGRGDRPIGCVPEDDHHGPAARAHRCRSVSSGPVGKPVSDPRAAPPRASRKASGSSWPAPPSTGLASPRPDSTAGCQTADTEETSRLWDTLTAWRPAVEVFITNAQPRLPQQRPPPNQYPTQKRPPGAATPLDQPRHHAQLRIAGLTHWEVVTGREEERASTPRRTPRGR